MEFLIGLFREAYEGNWRGGETYFVDNRPGAGMLDTLDLLSAEEASTVFVPGTATIAGHVLHLTVGMAATREEIDGASPEVDWEGTWRKQTVSPKEWEEARRSLRAEYEALLARFRDRPAMEPLAYSTAHATWHLGAIRQLMGERVERQG
jgi:hypothetical protein